jgi:acetolactate synthase regulatory subunit
MTDVVPSESAVFASFHVLADTCPGLLPRLLQPLAKRDLVADAFHARREGDETRVEMALHAMPAGMVHLVAGNLGQVVGVREVRVVVARRDGQEALRRAA